MTDNLSTPISVQNIGGREIEYFNVSITDGRKRAWLQLSYEGATIPDSTRGVVCGGFVVESVKVC